MVLIGSYQFDDSGFKALKRPPVAIDGGANHGEFSVNWMRHGGRVVGVEPTEALCQEIGAKSQGLDGVFLGAALGAREGVRDFYVWDDDQMSSLFDKTGIKHDGREVVPPPTQVVQVPVITLEMIIFTELGGVPPDVLKLDVEGAEFEILLESDLYGINQIAVEFHRECDPGDRYTMTQERLADEFDTIAFRESADGHHVVATYLRR